MDLTNINDPAGIKALLEQLKESQAWQEVQNQNQAQATASSSSSRSEQTKPGSDPRKRVNPSSSAEGLSEQRRSSDGTTAKPSVAALLSQLQSSSSFSSLVAPLPLPSHATESHLPSTPIAGPSNQASSLSQSPPAKETTALLSARQKDPRSLNFQQALLHIARLSDDHDFVAKIKKLKQEQNVLELRLSKERKAIQEKQREKVKVAQTKASIIGLSKHETDSMTDTFRKELRQFDSERVLRAWDGLISKQQATLEGLGVPLMFVTTTTADREKQQKVMTVLNAITDDGSVIEID